MKTLRFCTRQQVHTSFKDKSNHLVVIDYRNKIPRNYKIQSNNTHMLAHTQTSQLIQMLKQADR